MHVRLEAASFFFQSQSMQHCFCCVLLGSRIKVRVDVRRRAEITVPQPLLNLFERHMVRKQQARAAVPLRYNYDKPGKPRISRVFGYLARFFILFQTEKSSREVVIS